MIKLETAHIEEMRGIRKLNLDFSKHNFAISGPNGYGKSGVVDAMEFGLTGDISRLRGRGTNGLSVTEHGSPRRQDKIPRCRICRIECLHSGARKIGHDHKESVFAK